ncbi:MAG: chemotaxis protein CheW [Photobacterium frigidiphilum]|uniref:chemotaxis protein CheW n=1 Tax=Photobacterium frigidiphilum TaxID=264736 RepID=UPI003001F47D
MNDKSRLSSEQALDDYFNDLLVEPSVVEDDAVSDETSIPFDFEQLAESRENDTGTQLESASSVLAEQPILADVDRRSKKTQQGLDWTSASKPEPVLTIRARAASLSEQVLPESSRAFEKEASCDEHFAELGSVQRLLSQMTSISTDSEVEVEVETETEVEIETECVSTAEIDAESLTVTQQDTQCATSDDIDIVTSESISEKTDTDTDVAVQVEAGGEQPPEQWHQLDKEQDFQALFFEVCGVTFAVALTELGGIHQMMDLNRLMGRPAWYLGLLTSKEQQFDVVDTARWVMADKLQNDDYKDDFSYIVMLGDSKWGLACDKLHGTEVLTSQSVRWREKAGKRPWLAGMVKEKMCALIHVNALISMLNEGLDVKSIV